MKILHISKYYDPYKGGIENVVLNLVEGSRAEGYHVDVLCFNDSNKDVVQVVERHTIFRSKRLFTLFSLPISFSYLFKIFKIINNYDIIHVHLPNPLSVIGIFLVNTKSKIVVHWHSDIIEQKILYSLLSFFHKMVLQKADKIIMTTNNYLESSTQLYNFHNKCEIIPIGIPDINTSCKNFTETHDDNQIVVFGIGRLVTYKGFEKLISSSEFLDNNIKIIIAGNGPLKIKLSNLIKDLNLGNRVTLVGYLSESELISYYKKADIFCLPSITRNEAFGVVLLEAMMFSLPIVCFNIPGSGVPWVAKNKYNAEVVDKINCMDLAEAINNLSRDKELLKQYSINSRERYLSEFTSEKMQKDFNRLYQNI